MAAVMAVSWCGSVYASEVEENNLVQVGEYECYVKDGQYYTEIDGESYLVIELGNDAVECDTSIIPYAYGWENGPVIDISNGSYYAGTISEANNCSPIIKGNTEKDYRIKISNLIGFNNYKFTIFYYNSAYNHWYSEAETLLFIGFIDKGNVNVLFSGTAKELITKIRFECCLEDSSGPIPFTYRVYQ